MTAGRRAVISAVVLLVVLAGCGSGSPNNSATLPPQTFGPDATTGAEAAATRHELTLALGAASLQLTVPQVPHRPAESPAFAAAPRDVYQVVLRDDPTHGFISVYAFADRPAAEAAGREQAAYVASGPGRVQFPPDTRFVIRVVDTTVVFFAWSPANSLDPRTEQIQRVLETVGTGVPIPN